MTAPLHRRTEEIGACLADPFANGEGTEKCDTFTIPMGGAGGGCIDPATNLATTALIVNPNNAERQVNVRIDHASDPMVSAGGSLYTCDL
jgi:hypothetical protein